MAPHPLLAAPDTATAHADAPPVQPAVGRRLLAAQRVVVLLASVLLGVSTLLASFAPRLTSADPLGAGLPWAWHERGAWALGPLALVGLALAGALAALVGDLVEVTARGRAVGLSALVVLGAEVAAAQHRPGPGRWPAAGTVLAVAASLVLVSWVGIWSRASLRRSRGALGGLVLGDGWVDSRLLWVEQRPVRPAASPPVVGGERRNPTSRTAFDHDFEFAVPLYGPFGAKDLPLVTAGRRPAQRVAEAEMIGADLGAGDLRTERGGPEGAASETPPPAGAQRMAAWHAAFTKAVTPLTRAVEQLGRHSHDDAAGTTAACQLVIDEAVRFARWFDVYPCPDAPGGRLLAGWTAAQVERAKLIMDMAQHHPSGEYEEAAIDRLKHLDVTVSDLEDTLMGWEWEAR